MNRIGFYSVHTRDNSYAPVFVSFNSVFSVFGGGLSAQQVNRSPVVLPAVPSEEVSIQLLSLRDERVKSDYEVALVMAGETEF